MSNVKLFVESLKVNKEYININNVTIREIKINEKESKFDNELFLEYKGKTAGHIKYTVISNVFGISKVYLKTVLVYNIYRRLGFGEYMIDWIVKNISPYSNINWGKTLSDGKELKNNLDKKYLEE